MKLPLRRLFSAALVALVFTGLYWARTSGFLAPTAEVVRHQGATMGSYFAYSYVAPKGFGQAEQLALKKGVEALLEDFNQKLSTYRPDSLVSRFNQARTTDWVSVPQELIVLLKYAADVRAKSQGALDLTIAPLANAWGFGSAPKRTTLPGAAAISKAKSLVNQSRLRVDSNASRIAKAHAEMAVDINSIAPGYAADLMGELFEARGIQNYLVDIGGEVRARGEKGAGQAWVVGIETPVDSFARGVEAKVELKNLSLATSGNYRNYFERDGKRYSHVLDARTGQPISHRLASVTVLHEKAVFADAWATALLVLGPEHGMQVAKREGLGVLMLVAREGGGFDVQATPEFERQTPKSRGVR